MNTINTIREWIRHRPLSAVALAAWFGITSTAAGFREDWMPYLFAMFAIPLIVMAVALARFGRTVLLAAILVFDGLPTQADEPPPPTAEAAPVGVAVVVVVVGGVCVYLLVRTCQKLFPKTPAPSTNSPPNVGGKSDDTAGSWTYSGFASCYQPQSEPQWPTVTMQLDGVIGENGTFTLTGSQRMTQTWQDYNAFQADLARHGIGIGPVGTMCYGRNGRPAYEAEVPIRFSGADNQHQVAVYSDTAPSIQLVIQRSFDLQTWNNFGYVSVPVGSRFRLIDTTSAQSAFYRIQPK